MPGLIIDDRHFVQVLEGNGLMFKFLHTADWQIGKQFANIQGDAAAFLRNQRIDTVKRIGALAVEHNVDAVLVAGDVFETNLVKGQTIFKTMTAMADTFEGKWLLLPGNHDSAESNSVWTRIRKSGFASRNIFFLDEPQPLVLKEQRAVILPAPLQRRHDMRDLTSWYDDYVSEPDMFRVGFAHGSMDNRLQQRGEAANTISDTRAEKAKLDYLALGDWHGTLNIAKRTWYSGTPEPDRFRSNDPGNVLCVTLNEPGAEPEVQRIPVGHYSWCEVDQQLLTNDDVDALDRTIRSKLSLDKTLVRLCLTGAISFETKLMLEEVLERLSASLFYLESDTSQLIAEPTQDDLDQLDQTGFVRAAVQRLLEIKADVTNPDCEAARLALQMLYAQHKRVEAQCK